MRIEELIPDLAITLFVTINDEQLSFESKILEVLPKKHLVLAEAVYRNDKIITFRGKNIIVDLLVSMPDEKPQLFKNVTVTLVKKADNTLCYSLTTVAESKTYNRRQSFRCFVGINTAFRCGTNRVAHPTTIRDVSVTGFSIVCDNDIKLEQNQIIHTILKDYFEESAEKFSFHLYGIVVRVQELENGRTLYGCRLNNHVPGLEAYIVKKERLHLRKNNI